MTMLQTRSVIFISYAHEDERKWLSFVTGFLKPAERNGTVEIWTDRVMPGGADWVAEIEHKLRVCDIFVLLVSRYSMASDFVVDKEIRVIRERQAKAEDVHFYPLLLTPTPEIALDEVRDKNMRPLDAKPFSDFSQRDQFRQMNDAANEIVKIGKEIATRKSELAPSPASPSALASPATAPSREKRRRPQARMKAKKPLREHAAPSAAAASSAPEPTIPTTLPPNPRMIGRKDRLEELVKAILDEDRPIVVPGVLGMGKTTLALAAAYDERVIARFGKGRRFFVNLEPAPDADDLLRRLAADLGLAASGAASELEATIASACAAAPTLAILDNLETPWRKDTAATEAMLGRLAPIEGLRLILTIRGDTPHLPGPGALTLRDVERLGEADAVALFLRHAGDQFSADPDLPGLVRALDGHPLSIELLAANAQGKANLRGLAAAWRDRRADMLRLGDAGDRKTSLRASLELSLEALRPSSAAHRLIRLMALLPDGMSEADSRTLLSDGEPTREELGATLRLESARLAGRPDGRWRLLAPVRETLLADFPPEKEDRGRLVKLFLARAALGRIAGTSRWGEVSEVLIVEAGNLDAMVGVAIGEPALPEGLGPAVRGLAQFHIFTGLASAASLLAVAARFHYSGDVLGEADCIMSLGDITLDRSDHAAARERYEAALSLFRRVGDVLGEANCIKSLGDIALRRSDHEEARKRYEAALPLYQEVGDVLGEANCIFRLGNIALARSDHEEARRRCEAALPLHRKVGDVLGEANCIKTLGNIVLERSDYKEARQRYEAALPLYQKVGDVLGEANCIKSLGNIALHHFDHKGARECYEAALPLYQRVGDVLGEANCIRSLGDIARDRSDHDGARQRYEAALELYQKVGDVLGEANCIQCLGDIAERQGEVAVARERWLSALALYTKIPDPYSIGFAHNRLARRAATPEEAAEHREAARKAWESIDRQDLIEKHLDKTA